MTNNSSPPVAVVSNDGLGLPCIAEPPTYTHAQLQSALMAQRERDAQLCDEFASAEGIAQMCAAAIRGQL